MLYEKKLESPLGNMEIISDGENIVGLYFIGQKYFMENIRGKDLEEKKLDIFDRAKAWLDSYFRGENPQLDLPLKAYGSPFRKMVWDILLKIPYGKTRTYGEIAEEIAISYGKPSMSSQAVGGAVGHNPISIMIPCHRVLGKDGNLTGYAGGINKKVELLRLEGIDTSSLSLPKNQS